MNEKDTDFNMQRFTAELEALVGFKLPSSFSEFATNSRNHKISLGGHFVKELRTTVIVDVLFGLGLHRDFDLVAWNKEYIAELHGIGVIVGGDPFGNLFVLNGRDSVYYWDQIRLFENSSDDRNAYLVAAKFADFIEAGCASDVKEIAGPLGPKLPEGIWHSSEYGMKQEINRWTFVEFAREEGFQPRASQLETSRGHSSKC